MEGYRFSRHELDLYARAESPSGAARRAPLFLCEAPGGAEEQDRSPPPRVPAPRASALDLLEPLRPEPRRGIARAKRRPEPDPTEPRAAKPAGRSEAMRFLILTLALQAKPSERTKQLGVFVCAVRLVRRIAPPTVAQRAMLQRSNFKTLTLGSLQKVCVRRRVLRVCPCNLMRGVLGLVSLRPRTRALAAEASELRHVVPPSQPSQWHRSPGTPLCARKPMVLCRRAFLPDPPRRRSSFISEASFKVRVQSLGSFAVGNKRSEYLVTSPSPLQIPSPKFNLKLDRVGLF